MIPQLLISKNSRITNNYLKKIVQKNDIFFEIKPEGKEFSIKEIKNIIKESSIFHPEKRIYFLENFHLSSLEAQNAFLKILEEPPNNTLFILSTDNQSKLISTIISRTKIINLENNLNQSLNIQTKEKLNNFLKSKKLKLNLDVSLDDLIIYFKERLQSDKNAPHVLKEILKVKTLLENNNLNLQMTLDHILIFISKTYNMK